ncbi:MAG: hypothetical protein H0U43_09660 [Chthoniobacterales bacterium]|nr:hypothetical protein [Chthoniobacterales bacterium]
MPDGGNVFGQRKIMGPRPEEAEQSQRVWDEVSKYPFVHLSNDTCVISVRPPAVVFLWGGALVGHWGISVGGSTEDKHRESSLQTIRFSDGMILFRGQ